MTVSLPPQPNASKDAQAARKRRRRAPAGGAADDCFTCIKRSTKCDRRRPYCSQCLEIGNECSGYKTQLTWGVGVASRGKLRGLSLPIAKAPPVAPVGKKSASRARASSAATSTQWNNMEEGPRKVRRDNVTSISGDHGVILPPTTYAAYPEYPRFSQAESIPTTSQRAWSNLPAYAGNMSAHDASRYGKIHHNSMNHFPLMGESLSSSVDSLSDVDYTLSPGMGHSYPREEISFVHSPNVIYENYTTQSSPVPQSPVSAIMIDQRAPTSCPSLAYTPSEPSSSLSSHPESFEPRMGHGLVGDSDTLSVPEMEPYATSAHPAGGPFWLSPNPKDDDVMARAAEPTAAGLAPPFESQPIQVSPDLMAKMEFFMDYYENIMCPSMVLTDGPNNPYRSHILQLASGSRSLQHAICALSACNLRMKRRLSLGQHARDSEINGSERLADVQSDRHSLSEEHQHRNLAVHLLNQQLNDPSKSCHDSVLATILLLCHYRMVESGVAKFQTQFAGVKKILSMRGSAPYQGASDSSWMEAIFTYFDSISASINDREAQLDHAFYGLPSDANLLPPGIENLVGCDRELFKTISKLGRLNLLSQSRRVQNSLAGSPGHVRTPSAASPLGSPLGRTFKQAGTPIGDFFSVNHHRYDSNGFAVQLDEEDILSAGLCSPSPSQYDDHHSGFWREWKEARAALQSWEFDAQRVAASLPSQATASQVRDLHSLSEAFRYAALLYTERLASPGMPSSHNKFRNLVSQVVYYATSLEAGSSADKFLLWPLFVAGSECVNELQQNIVRNKCREIMSRSGYMNNLAAIEVLERLWAGEYYEPPATPSGKLSARRGSFNWTKCIGGPGVEVEWIMF
ncbi:fungal-specific transcription factor domain-containing protein [Durotheca rogersii]|uniref:fungal-specific transcription factor domain-containing protein n=1 Tax=Durotheca rogersii TaxID=419775 RepID=UPI00222009F5|nr:fungal-specific transcription factor domain-containing protein [Durotheca rogersii]KAI5862910.1 fungal-specific transcription factor domain-containing protein [Durotheca rogersii]